jgi:hypothetical protein
MREQRTEPLGHMHFEEELVLRIAHPISQRLACVLIGVGPKTVRRERPPDNPEIREEMNRIAENWRRFG